MDASVPLHHREFRTEPDSSIAGPSWSDPKPARLSPPSSPSSKRSRRSVQKRVVSIPIQEAEGSRAKGVGECAPPSDSWAWRKYGQKPIKGSPYPRGYYRCSSSKGCPARKQVERSRVDPTVLMVTYTCEHNHPWPAPKGQSNSKLQQQSQQPPPVKESSSNSNSSNSDPDPDAIMGGTPEPVVSAAADPEESRSMFSDLIGEDFSWFSDVGSTSSTSPPSDTFLYGPIFGSPAELAADDSYDKIKDDADGEGEDALFAGLEELPEYSVVFRRRYWDPQTAAASW